MRYISEATQQNGILQSWNSFIFACLFCLRRSTNSLELVKGSNTALGANFAHTPPKMATFWQTEQMRVYYEPSEDELQYISPPVIYILAPTDST